MAHVSKVAVVWRGDREARRIATPENNRFYRVFEELNTIGINAEPAVYDEDFADEVVERYARFAGVHRINPFLDQPFLPRLPDGMIRCYMGTDKVVGFGHSFAESFLA